MPKDHNRRRFQAPKSAEAEAVDAQWKELTERQFNDEELELFHAKLEQYHYLASTGDLKRFYVDMGAASWAYPPNQEEIQYRMDASGHLLSDRIDNKISQWSKWRTRKFGGVRRNYELDKQASAHTVTHHDDFGDFDLE